MDKIKERHNEVFKKSYKGVWAHRPSLITAGSRGYMGKAGHIFTATQLNDPAHSLFLLCRKNWNWDSNSSNWLLSSGGGAWRVGDVRDSKAEFCIRWGSSMGISAWRPSGLGDCPRQDPQLEQLQGQPDEEVNLPLSTSKLRVNTSLRLTHFPDKIYKTQWN